MRRPVRIALVSVVVGGLVALGVSRSGTRAGQLAVPPPVPTIEVGADKPPSPKRWPPYPTFSAHSCWTRPSSNGVMRAAPSVRLEPRGGTPPSEIARRLLARFGDRRYVERIAIGKPPAHTLQHLHGYYGGARPPADALWAYIEAPAAMGISGAHPTPEQLGVYMLAEWEAELVVGALRDDFCEAGGAPLVGWSIKEVPSGVSDGLFALEQRFPNPSPAAFRRRIELVGRRYGFRAVSLRLLRPRQLAPLLVVETSRERKAFVRDIPAIVELLDPTATAGGQNARTFEGFMLEARDANGPFVRVNDVSRGEAAGGQWSWDRCVYPFDHSQPVRAKPCP